MDWMDWMDRWMGWDGMGWDGLDGMDWIGWKKKKRENNVNHKPLKCKESLKQKNLLSRFILLESEITSMETEQSRNSHSMLRSIE